MGSAGTLRRWVDGSQADGTPVQRLVTFAVGVGVIAGAIAVDTVVFRAAFDGAYVQWYVKNGALITILFGLITFAWGDLNRMTSLISAHPHDFVASCFHLAVLPQLGSAALIETRGTWLKRMHRERAGLTATVTEAEQLAHDPTIVGGVRDELATLAERGRHDLGQLESDIELVESTAPESPPPRGLGPLDELLAIIFAFAFLLLVAFWVLVIAPLQYVVNLVAGAPARRALASPVRTSFRSTPRVVVVAETPKQRALPEGATESGFSTKPVAFTSAVASILLFLVATFAPIDSGSDHQPAKATLAASRARSLASSLRPFRQAWAPGVTIPCS